MYVIDTIYNNSGFIVEQVDKWKDSGVGYWYSIFEVKRNGERIVLSNNEVKPIGEIQEGEYSNI